MLLEWVRLVLKKLEYKSGLMLAQARKDEYSTKLPSRRRDRWQKICASIHHLAAETLLFPCFRGKREDPGVDLGHVSPRFLLPKPLQPINIL